LGGQYVYRQTPEGTGSWTSTALEGSRRPSLLAPQVPDGFQAPPLNWFRGLDLQAAVTDDALDALIQLDMQWPPPKADAATGQQGDGARDKSPYYLVRY
jgi:hypothetical protein